MKKSYTEITLSYSCFPKPKPKSTKFKSPYVERLLNNVDFYGGQEPIGFFRLFSKTLSKPFVPERFIFLDI